jgi:uncharacterized membrane protein
MMQEQHLFNMNSIRLFDHHHPVSELVDENKLEKDSIVTENKTPISQKPSSKGPSLATAAASVALGASLLGSTALFPLEAQAAMSGGRMGGSFSAPSRQSYSRPAAPRSYAPSFRGGGGPIITPYVVPAPIPFFTPPIVPFWGSPFSPGVGVISYHRGPGLFDLLFLGGLVFAMWNIVSSVTSSATMTDRWSDEGSIFSRPQASPLGVGTSVVRLSVAVNVPNRDDPNSLLSTLSRLAASAKTDSRKSVQNLTSQVAVELLRRKSSIVSAATESRKFGDNHERSAERTFEQWSVQERSKFEKELVSKFGGIDTTAATRRSSRASDDGGKATLAVVTLVVSIQGDSTANQIPNRIRSLADVEQALRQIAADVRVDDCLLGAEILWTPEDRDEVLSRRDVIADYPELVNV